MVVCWIKATTLSNAHNFGSFAVDTNAPDIQAAFWIGGYRGSGTTSTITDSTEDYVGGMVQLNTTTGQYTSLTGPYDAVQEGSLSYIPVGDMGILVYMGGEVPSIADGINATLTSVSFKAPLLRIVSLINKSEFMGLCPSLRHRYWKLV